MKGFKRRIEFEDGPATGRQGCDANENMNKPTALRMIGEGVLIFHATAVLPIWSELTLQTDGSYPFARNILLEIMFLSVPYSVCLLLSHPLYRKTQTNAPLISCLLSLAMFAGTLYLWSLIKPPRRNGDNCSVPSRSSEFAWRALIWNSSISLSNRILH